MSDKRKLYRDTDNKQIFGVCSGLGDYFSLDVTLIRVLWVISVLFAGTGLLLYIILAIVIEPKNVVLKKDKAKTVDDSDDPFAKYDR